LKKVRSKKRERALSLLQKEKTKESFPSFVKNKKGGKFPFPQFFNFDFFIHFITLIILLFFTFQKRVKKING